MGCGRSRLGGPLVSRCFTRISGLASSTMTIRFRTRPILRRLVPAVTLGVALALGSVPAQASDSADIATSAIPVVPLSYLFAVDSGKVRVVPGKEDRGTVIVALPATFTRFTDRPGRDTRLVRAQSVLRAFGWTEDSDRFTGKVPNAAVAIAGSVSQVVELRAARIQKNRVVFKVKALAGPLEERAGAGSIFIDNADPGSPASQSSSIGYSGLSFTSTYAPNMMLDGRPLPTITVSVYVNGSLYTVLTLLSNNWVQSFEYEPPPGSLELDYFTGTVVGTVGPDGGATVKVTGTVYVVPPGENQPYSAVIASWPATS